MQYMEAVLIAHTKDVRSDGAIVEVVIWQLPKPLPPLTIDQLLDDFERDIADWR